MDGYNMMESSKNTLIRFIKYVNYIHGMTGVDLV